MARQKHRVHNKNNEKGLSKPLLSVEDLMAQESLEQVTQPAVGEKVLHLVKNSHGDVGAGFRASLAQAEVVVLSEQPLMTAGRPQLSPPLLTCHARRRNILSIFF